MDLEKIGGALKRALPTILTVLGSVGVVGTAVLTAKATQKIDEEEITWKDNKKEFAKAYKWAALAGVGTIGCIAGSNILSNKLQASIASGALLFTEPFRQYQQKVKEKFGEAAHEEIMEEIKMERAKDDVYVYSSGILSSNSIALEGLSEQTQQFCDLWSKDCFECRPTQVLQAMYHANRNFTLGGVEMYNQYREFCGLKPRDDQDDFMWAVNDDMLWIDFNIERRKDRNGNDILVNGRPIYDISVEWDPKREEEWEYEYPHAAYHDADNYEPIPFT
ncbi:MAG: hypothetical protein J6Y02_11780 [Pseudobutyrivibrio sp.]|nr:hypothetical protein [Lachnospiraceae bacterium]MBP5596054.1 hypothetical protein [Pseudobutyrivibrio sp.]